MTDFSEGRAWLETAVLPEPLPHRMAVAWSGGVDSTALLLALHAAGHEVEAWHVDHGWHADSADHSRQLESLAHALEIPFTSVRLQLANVKNREAEARQARYDALYELSQQKGLKDLCLAHHRDDQAETVCLRMLQGAGVAGCRGMAALRYWRDIRLFRPLLHVSKQALTDALKRSAVAWLEDRSNRDTSLWRNHIRHVLFPAMARHGADPADLFLRWGRQAALVTDIIDEQSARVAIICDGTTVWTEWATWRAQSQPVRVDVLQRMAAALSGEGVVMGRRHLLAVERWLGEGANGGLDLSRSRLIRKDGRLLLSK